MHIAFHSENAFRKIEVMMKKIKGHKISESQSLILFVHVFD